MKLILLASALLLGGCVTSVALPPLASDHPASPDAPTGPLPLISGTLQSYEPVAAVQPRPKMDHGAMEGMDHGAMDHGTVDHGEMHYGAMDHKSVDHNAPKQADQAGQETAHQHSSQEQDPKTGADYSSMDHGSADDSSMKDVSHGAHWMAPQAAAARKNPVPANKASIARGKALFQQNCVVCHGPAGLGDGPAAAGLNPKPPSLALMAGQHPDGDFAWKIENGRGAMPAWKGILTQKQIWDLVNYTKGLGDAKPKPAGGQSDHDHSKHKH